MRGVEDYGRNLSCTDNSLKSSEGLRSASFDRGMRVHIRVYINTSTLLSPPAPLSKWCSQTRPCSTTPLPTPTLPTPNASLAIGPRPSCVKKQSFKPAAAKKYFSSDFEIGNGGKRHP